MKPLQIISNKSQTPTISSFEELKNLLKDGKTILGLSKETSPATPFFLILENDEIVVRWNNKGFFDKTLLHSWNFRNHSYIIIENSDFEN